MPKVSVPAKLLRNDIINGVSVEIYEKVAKTKDKNGKEVSFTFQYPSFPASTTLSQLVQAETYTDSQKKVHPGEVEILALVNSARLSSARASKLNEINGALAMRENPEDAIRKMVDSLSVAYGLPREIVEKNIRATISLANESK